MRTKTRLIIIMLGIAFIACEKNDENKTANSAQLIGSWHNLIYTDSIVTFTRSASLEENEYGFSFNEDNSFIERKNSGWCGTPPVSYTDFDGTWTNNDTIIEISVGYWGGSAEYKWKIVTVDDVNLKIIILEQDYHLENPQ